MRDFPRNVRHYEDNSETNCLGDRLMPWPTAGREVRKFTREKEARERGAEESVIAEEACKRM